MQLTNWAGNLTYQAPAVHRPSTVAELQAVVARSPRVRALGTRHSFTPIADSPGALVSLSEIPPEISIDPVGMTVSVTGGTRYGVLAGELHAQGFGLHNTGSLPHISIAGATATGTHGSGDRHGVLATAVSALDLVTADGSLVTLDRSNPDLKAVALGLGAFGVVVRLTLDVEPTYQVRQDLYRDAPWDTVLDQFDEIMAAAYSVSLMADFAGPVVADVWLKTRLDDGGADVPDAVMRAARYGGTWRDDADVPTDSNLNRRAGVPGPWSERLPHFRLDALPSAGGDELQSEYFVDRRHGVDALQALRALGERISPHLGIAEIRTAAADDLWLSPAFGRESLCIGFTWRKHVAEVTALLPVIEAALAPFEPRPHWGKLFAMTAPELAPRLPRLPDALALMARYDPAGTFGNPFLDTVLGAVPGRPG